MSFFLKSVELLKKYVYLKFLAVVIIVFKLGFLLVSIELLANFVASIICILLPIVLSVRMSWASSLWWLCRLRCCLLSFAQLFQLQCWLLRMCTMGLAPSCFHTASSSVWLYAVLLFRAVGYFTWLLTSSGSFCRARLEIFPSSMLDSISPIFCKLIGLLMLKKGKL